MSRALAIGEAGMERGRRVSICDFWLAPALALIVLFGCSPGFAALPRVLSRSHDEAVTPFSIDVDAPYQTVLGVVNEVAHAGFITGTFEYKSDENLPGAEFLTKCDLFEPWSGPGTVVFKMRKRALAPSHFLNSNDVGTVAVRYIVQELGPNSTRLFIDAVFVENAGHHHHLSDGYVETSEFGAIAQKLKDAEHERLLTGQPLPRNESSSRMQAAPSVEPAPLVEPRTQVVEDAESDLLKAIAAQEASLTQESANMRQLQDLVSEARRSVILHVTAQRAEMKMFPYHHADTVQALKQGQEVTVIVTTPSWYRVRSADGQEGWIFRSLLEAQP